jgi:hypothetical protein
LKTECVRKALPFINIYENSKDKFKIIKDKVCDTYFDSNLINKFRIKRFEFIIDNDDKYIKIDATDVFIRNKLNTLNKNNSEALVELYKNRLHSHGYDVDNIDISKIRIRLICEYFESFLYVFTWSPTNLFTSESNISAISNIVEDDYNIITANKSINSFDYIRLQFLMDKKPLKQLEEIKHTKYYPELVYLADLNKPEKDRYTDVTISYINYIGPNANNYNEICTNHNTPIEWFLKDELSIGIKNKLELSNYELHIIPRSHELKSCLVKNCKFQFELKPDHNILPL